MEGNVPQDFATPVTPSQSSSRAYRRNASDRRQSLFTDTGPQIVDIQEKILSRIGDLVTVIGRSNEIQNRSNELQSQVINEIKNSTNLLAEQMKLIQANFMERNKQFD